MKLNSLVLLFVFTIFSCGIKGPPLPPLSDEIAQKQKSESVTVNTNQETQKAVSSDMTDGKLLQKRKQRR